MMELIKATPKVHPREAYIPAMWLMSLRRHIALASVNVATDFPGEHCNPAFSLGRSV
jgi:hypothetical protein